MYRLFNDDGEEFRDWDDLDWKAEIDGKKEIEAQLNKVLDEEGASFHIRLRTDARASITELEYKVDDSPYTGSEDINLLDI